MKYWVKGIKKEVVIKIYYNICLDSEMTIDMVSVNLKIVGMIKGFTSEENEVLKWIIIW